MSHALPLFLAYAPAAAAPTLPRPFTPVPMAYQAAPDGQLLRAGENALPAGSVLLVGGTAPAAPTGRNWFCRQVLAECRRQQAAGVLANWAETPAGETPPVLHRSGSLCPIGSQRTGADLLPALRRNAAGADTGSAGTVWFSCSAGAGVQSVCLCPPLSGRAGHDADTAGAAEAVRPPSVSGVVLGGFLLPVCHLSGDGAAPFDLV